VTLRSLARGSLLVTIANLVPRVGTFLLLPLYARVLTRDDFGTVSLAASAALLLSIALRLGLDSAVLRLHFDADGDGRRRLYATSLTLSVLVVAAASAVAVAVVLLAVRDGDARAPALLAVALGAASTLQYVPSVWYRATDRTGRYLALSLGSFVVVVAATVLLVVVLRLGAVGSLVGQLAGALVPVGAACVIGWRVRPWGLDRAIIGRALGFGLPLLPHTLAGWLLSVSDRWLLGALLTSSAISTLATIGVYSFGYQIGYAVGLVAVSFQAAWLPYLYAAAGERQTTLVASGTTVVAGGMAGLAGAIAVLAPDLVALVAPPDWASAADVTRIVAIASLANALSLLFAAALYVARRTRAVPLVTLGAAALNVVVNVVLIPRLGMLGAAWATLLAYGVLAGGTLLAARLRTTVRFELLAVTLVGSLAAAAALIGGLVLDGSGLAGTALRFVLVLALWAVLALLVRPAIRRVRGALAVPGTPDRPSAEPTGPSGDGSVAGSVG
jgi:O-antigen/teichoic acid export membrane protein